MKKTFMTLTMGAALITGMALTSCGGEKKAKDGEKASTEANAEGEKAAVELPADCKVYDASNMAAGKANDAANVAFAPSVSVTDMNVFEGNEAVQTLYIDHDINTINESAFKDCKNLKEIKASGFVMVAMDNAFFGCSGLKEYNVETATVGISTFENCTSLEKVNIGKQGNMINARAFAGCSKLKTVIIPMSVERLEEDAFEGCTALEEVTIPYNFKDRVYTFTAKASGIKKIFILTPDVYPFPTTAAAKAFNKAQCEAYVPDALVKKFQEDPSWQGFKAIKPLTESGYFTADGTIK